MSYTYESALKALEKANSFSDLENILSQTSIKVAGDTTFLCIGDVDDTVRIYAKHRARLEILRMPNNLRAYTLL